MKYDTTYKNLMVALLDRRMRVGWFGLLYAEVKVELTDGERVWKRATNREWHDVGLNKEQDRRMAEHYKGRG